MEPATVLAATVAAAALAATLGRAVGAFRLTRRPTRRVLSGGVVLLAGIVMSLTAGAGRWVSAATPPPLVRLAFAADASHGTRIRVTPAPPTHVVVPGDTLWDIAAAVLGQRLGAKPTSREIDGYWRRIYEANRETVGSDPNLIHPGQVLRLPAE